VSTTRARGERGTAYVSSLVLLFTFTAGGVIWLARDVNERVSNRSAAQSIAFQAARSGAQQIEIRSLRDPVSPAVSIDESAARRQIASTASRLFGSYDVRGTVEHVVIDHDTVRVEVRISSVAGDAIGVGIARAELGP
jgi:Tfp pilus assembly protein PilX